MVVYPLSAWECRVICWASRIVPVAAGAVILLLGAMSAAA